jgi:hypothetical protein
MTEAEGPILPDGGIANNNQPEGEISSRVEWVVPVDLRADFANGVEFFENNLEQISGGESQTKPLILGIATGARPWLRAVDVASGEGRLSLGVGAEMNVGGYLLLSSPLTEEYGFDENPEMARDLLPGMVDEMYQSIEQAAEDRDSYRDLNLDDDEESGDYEHWQAHKKQVRKALDGIKEIFNSNPDLMEQGGDIVLVDEAVERGVTFVYASLLVARALEEVTGESCREEVVVIRNLFAKNEDKREMSLVQVGKFRIHRLFLLSEEAIKWKSDLADVVPLKQILSSQGVELDGREEVNYLDHALRSLTISLMRGRLRDHEGNIYTIKDWESEMDPVAGTVGVKALGEHLLGRYYHHLPIARKGAPNPADVLEKAYEKEELLAWSERFEKTMQQLGEEVARERQVNEDQV